MTKSLLSDASSCARLGSDAYQSIDLSAECELFYSWQTQFKSNYFLELSVGPVTVDIPLFIEQASLNETTLLGLEFDSKNTSRFLKELSGIDLDIIAQAFDPPLILGDLKQNNEVRNKSTWVLHAKFGDVWVAVDVSGSNIPELHWQIPRRASAAVFNASIPILVSIAQVTVETDQFNRLGAGDALLIESRLPDGTLRAKFGVHHCRPFFSAVVQGNLLMIQEQSFDSTEERSNFLADSSTIIDVCLAPFAMSLQELTWLSPGQVIELPSTIESATLQLKVQGQVVAQGTLVALGDRLAVRIEKIRDTSGAASRTRQQQSHDA